MRTLTILAAAAALALPAAAFAQDADKPAHECCCEKMKEAGKSCCEGKEGHEGKDHGQMDHGQSDHGQTDHGQMDHGQHGAPAGN